MTINEFFVHLEKLLNGPYIKTSNRKTLRVNFVYCPITFVCAVLTNKHFDCDYWKEAAKELNLNYEDAQKIMLAADSDDTLGDYDREIRNRLERICGFQ